MRMQHLLTLSFLATFYSSAHAAIITTNGASDLLIAGPGVGYTPDFFDDTTLVVHGWDEVQSFALTSNIDVDITTPGTYSSVGSLTPGILLAGTVVNSHTLYFDPVGGSAVAGFQFDGTIIGVIVQDALSPADRFLASDFLIPGSVPFGNIPGAHFAARGVELGNNTDSVQVFANAIRVDLDAGSPGDQIRVLTTVVPEPATLCVTALSLLAMRRRRVSRK